MIKSIKAVQSNPIILRESKLVGTPDLIDSGLDHRISSNRIRLFAHFETAKYRY